MPFLAPIGAAILGGVGLTGATAGVAATVGALGLGAAGYGAYAAGSAMSGGNNNQQTPQVAPPPEIPPVAPAPTPETAAISAQALVEKQKRMRALSGGKTLLTSEAPILSGNAGKTLLGA